MDEVGIGFLIGKLLTVLIEQSVMAVKDSMSLLNDGLSFFSSSLFSSCLLAFHEEVQVRYSN